MSLKESALYRVISSNLLLATLVIALGCVAFAQSDAPPPPPPPPGGDMMWADGPGHGPGPMRGPFLGDIGEHKVVKGAPMSGDLVMTRDTTLADGNTIHTENQTRIYRDSVGRVRREVSFELNTPTTGAAKHRMIVITDPVAGYRYILDPDNKTAQQMPLHPPKGPRPGNREHQANGGPAEMGTKFDADVTKKSLGTKTVNGMQAEGTRVTRTIPAGQIGNAKAIEVVTERWISTDLQMPLTMTHTDPMMGTMTTKLSNVTRAEPDASLFQVPADYKITTGKPDKPFYMPMKP